MLRAGTAMENLVLGSLAAAAACCVMIPVDTIKTRLVTQGKEKHYHGMIHCLQTVSISPCYYYFISYIHKYIPADSRVVYFKNDVFVPVASSQFDSFTKTTYYLNVTYTILFCTMLY